MRLRSDIGEVEDVLADWWQEFSMARDDLRRDMVDAVREEQTQRQRAPRVHKAPAQGDAASPTNFAPGPATEPSAAPDGSLGEGEEQGAAGAPRKRRRRRRPGGARPAGDAGGAASDDGSDT